MTKDVAKDTIIIMLISDLFWFCGSCFNVDETLVGYESWTDAQRNGVLVGAVNVIVDMESTVGIVVGSRDESDGDIVGDEDGKMKVDFEGASLGLILGKSFDIELVLYCLQYHKLCACR